MAAVVAPRLQVVGDARDLEAAILRVLHEFEQLAGAELLVGRLVAEGEGHTSTLFLERHRPRPPGAGSRWTGWSGRVAQGDIVLLKVYDTVS